MADAVFSSGNAKSQDWARGQSLVVEAWAILCRHPPVPEVPEDSVTPWFRMGTNFGFKL